MKKPIWVVNANYVRKNTPASYAAKVTTDQYNAKIKRDAEARMAVYDKQPKAVRAEIGENGMGVLLTRRFRSGADKIAAIRQARQQLLAKTAVCI